MVTAHIAPRLEERFAKMLILGIGNKSRHGKDTLAASVDSYFAKIDAAAERHGLRHTPVEVQHLAFADTLYKEVNAFLSSFPGARWIQGEKDIQIDTNVFLPAWVTPSEQPLNDPRAPLGKHPKLLQFWGTEYRRAQDSNYWVKQWKAAINPKANIILTTDMRFTNEAEAIKSVGGFTVNVSRLNVDGTKFIDLSRDPLHPSETQLDGYNYDFEITVKTGDQALLEEYAITLVHYLRALKGHK
jgi:hypothetical protein